MAYNPNDLRIVDEGPSGWLLTDGRSRMLILDNRQDAERALALARRYTSHCFIGRDNTKPNRDDYVHEYWLGESGIPTVIPGEDGLEATRRLVAEGDGATRVLILTTFDLDEYVYDGLRAGASGFLLTDGFSRMAMYATREDAEEGLRVAKLGTKQCFIGRNNTRPNRKDYIVEYWK